MVDLGSSEIAIAAARRRGLLDASASHWPSASGDGFRDDVTAGVDGAAYLGGPVPTPVRWTALLCTMPTRPARLRLTAWRELNRLRALNLHKSMWAIPHGELGEPSLDALFDVVSRAGGTAHRRDVNGRGSDDLDLELRLAATCEHLWDAFFNDVDRLSVRLAALPPDHDTMLALDALRRRYRELFALDIVGSPASVRAWSHLRECGDVTLRAGATIDDAEASQQHDLARPSAVACVDGSIRYEVPLHPMPSHQWERAFTDFEDYAYRPDPNRVALEHGGFVVRCCRDERDDQVGQLQARVDRFERSIA